MKKIVVIMSVLASILSFLGCNKPSSKKTLDPQEIKMIDPKDILMTLPTIENTLPSTNNNRLDSLNLEILEDDWRQLEFISKEYLPLIKQEIDSINLIIKNQSVDSGEGFNGYKDLHVRTLIPDPIKDNINILSMKKEFASLEKGSLSFFQYGKVNNAISIKTNSFKFYAIEEGDNIKVLGLYGINSNKDIANSISKIKEFMSKNNLLLVDWVYRKCIESEEVDSYIKPIE